MAHKRAKHSAANRAGPSPLADAPPAPPRIIGGRYARRRLKYSGDPRTRPMKDRVREAVFNLIGPAIVGKHALDLFAGTGALGLEALSRGAVWATFVEHHFPTADIIRENVAALAVHDVCQVLPADTFIWSRRLPPPPAAAAGLAWVVFCSPPFDFYHHRTGDMLGLIERLLRSAPPASIFVVEADEPFDFATLPLSAEWDVRHYPPAQVGILRLPSAAAEDPFQHGN